MSEELNFESRVLTSIRSVEYLGDDLSSGILGYISERSELSHAHPTYLLTALGVDTSASYSIHNTNALGQGE